MSDSMKVVVIYHDRCPDGAVAAWCASKFYENELDCDLADVFYHPTIHGNEPPWKEIHEADKTYILDFSYSRGEMIKMSTMTELLVLDHHASAEARCHGLDFCQFDMNKSGAGMAWDHFFPNESRPWLVDYVEDRDIWKWEFGNSKDALAFLDTLPREFSIYDQIYDGGITLGECVEKGAAIRGYIDQYIEDTLEAGRREITFAAPDGEIHRNVPIINASYKGISELVNEIAVGHKFALGYFRRNDGKYQYSVRVPEDSDFDGAKFAALYGGGGHKKAAGFSLDAELREANPAWYEDPGIRHLTYDGPGS